MPGNFFQIIRLYKATFASYKQSGLQVAAYKLFCHGIKGSLILKCMLLCINMKCVVSEAFSNKESNASPHLGLVVGGLWDPGNLT